MKHGFRQSMAWLHVWAGLLVGWVLFSIFITGSATYYRLAITDWMQPERLVATASGKQTDRYRRVSDNNGNNTLLDNQSAAAQQSLAFLTHAAPDAASWEIDLPDAMSVQPKVSWQDALQGSGHGAFHGPVAPLWPPVAVRDTRGGEFFYGFHFQLYYLPVLIGRWIVGFSAMSMLIALITGIITHRRIFVDFFTFRPRKGQRSWLDAHNVSAVLALPYHLMITYTGLVLLMINLMPWGMAVRYSSPMSFFSEAYDFGPVRATPTAAKSRSSTSSTAIAAPADTPLSRAPLTPVAPLLAQASAQFGGLPSGRIQIDHPGRPDATIKISEGTDGHVSIAPQSIAFDGISGAPIVAHRPPGTATRMAGTLFGIHEAEFAPAPLRAFFFLSGLSGALMVASGLIMWAKKHRQRHAQHQSDHIGTRLVEQLNVTTIAGLPCAVAAYFWANRLLPVGLGHRSGWEIRVFFIAWALAFVHPWWHAWRGKWLAVGRRAWVEQLGAGAALFALLPLVDRMTIGEWVMPAFDLVCCAIAAFLAIACAAVRRHRRNEPTQKQRRRAPASTPPGTERVGSTQEVGP